MNPFDFPGECVPGVRLLGRRFNAYVTFVTDEMERRSSSGLSEPLPHAMLDVLAQLMVDMPVKRTALSIDARHVIDTMPSGVVEYDGDYIIRRWQPSINLHGVTVESSSMKVGIARTAVFTSFAPRGILLRSPLDPVAPLVEEASLLGIGVAYQPHPEAAVEVLATPAVRPIRLGTTHWKLAELIFHRAMRLQHAAAKVQG